MIAASATITAMSSARRPAAHLRLAGWSGYLAVAGVLLSVSLSASALSALGVPYSVPGGNPVYKIHAGSYLVLFATALMAVATNPFLFAWRSVRAAPACAVYVAANMVILLYTVLRFGMSGTAFIIDTLLTPGLLALVLVQAPPAVAARGYRLLLGLLALNALIAIVEASTGRHLIPYVYQGQPVIELHFRATALLNHPLSGALVTAVALFGALGAGFGTWVRAGLCLLFGVALLAFGGRTALAVAVGSMALWCVLWGLRAAMLRLLRPGHLVAMTGLLITLGFLVGIAYLWLGLGERIIASLHWDASADARLHVFAVFNLMFWDEVLFGVTPERLGDVLAYMSQYWDLSVIENFWLVLLAQLGAYFFVMFVAVFAGLLWWLARRASDSVRLMIVAFVLVASSNNSLSTKNPALSVLVLLTVGILAEQGRLHRPVPRPPPPSTGGR